MIVLNERNFITLNILTLKEKKMDIFERGAREKIRFHHHGNIMIEDLWYLTLLDLDGLYHRINNELKALGGEGLLKNNINDTVSILQLQADLVRYVFDDKQEKLKIAKNEKIHQERKKRIMEIITNKQDQALEEKSVDELMNMLNEI